MSEQPRAPATTEPELSAGSAADQQRPREGECGARRRVCRVALRTGGTVSAVPNRFDDRPREARQAGQHSGAHGKAALHALLDFIPDAMHPYEIVDRLLERMAPKSYLSLSHCTGDFADA